MDADKVQLLKIKLMMEQVITEREGMMADNKQREAEDASMAYVAGDFEVLRLRLEDIQIMLPG